jgi:predicted negative regulator of RcsB-dependent stress response
MKKLIVYIIVILFLTTLSVIAWRHYSHSKLSYRQAQIITYDKKTDLSAKEAAAINRRSANFIQPGPNAKLPQAVPADVKRNIETINEIQRINQLNKKQK